MGRFENVAYALPGPDSTISVGSPEQTGESSHQSKGHQPDVPPGHTKVEPPAHGSTTSDAVVSPVSETQSTVGEVLHSDEKDCHRLSLKSESGRLPTLDHPEDKPVRPTVDISALDMTSVPSSTTPPTSTKSEKDSRNTIPPPALPTSGLASDDTDVVRTVDPAGAKNLGPLGRRETEGVRQPVER